MSKVPENEIKATEGVPATVYHIVPADLFASFIDAAGNYDCRNRKEWGKNSGSIHTTSDIETLKKRIVGNFVAYKSGVDFRLLAIDTGKIPSRFTYVVQNGNEYFHIWGALPKDSFAVSTIKRIADGGFEF